MTDTKIITEVLEALLGGCACPIGETNTDKEKFKIQKTEEEVINWLLDDIYSCLQQESVYWGSGRNAGARARHYLSDLYDELGVQLDIKSIPVDYIEDWFDQRYRRTEHEQIVYEMIRDWEKEQC